MLETADMTAIEKMMSELPEKALNLGIKVLLAALVLIIGLYIIKFVRTIVKKSMSKAGADAGITQFIDSLIKAAMYVLLIVIIAQYFGVQATSIVAIIGSAGVAVGLALQGSLANLAGGVLILLLRPFKIGDYIIDGSGKEGVVSEISIFYTKLKTVDNKVIVLPNGTLANNSIVNVTAEPFRNLQIELSVSYHSDLAKVREVLTQTIKNNKYILADRDVLVAIDELQDSGIKVILRGWLKTSDYWAGKWSLVEEAKVALNNAGIEIPFPQMDVHMK